ncbi:MAG: hypothetical protein JSS70_11295 [Bacteroidetes bacterium]|nr:hypothetical protein [Bacteroidota bacterium]
MVYDGFIFSYELELLDLRLAYLNDVVDYFVIVESTQTLSGNPKKLYYKENEKRYEQYKHKIIHLECPRRPEMNAWEYEYYQRNYIKQGLINCKDDDLVLISDLDEIVNLKKVLAVPGLTLPALIELPISYYFFNLRSNHTYAVNLLAKYDFIKDFNIGRRLPDYTLNIKNVVSNHQVQTGWHFSFLFGFEIEKYKNKIRSFSHQEYNTPYFLNENRIFNCVKFGIDFCERGMLKFNFKNAKKELGELYPYVTKSNLLKYIYSPKVKDYLSIGSLYFIASKKYIPRAGFMMRKFFYFIFLPVWKLVKPVFRKNELVIKK